MHGKPFHGSLRAVVEHYVPEDVVHVNYVTTAVAYDFALDRWGGLGSAERRVRRALGIPAAVSLGSYLRHTTTTVAPSLVQAHIRRLGSLGAWLRFVDRHAHAGTPAQSYAAKGEAPAVSDGRDGPGAAISALDANRSDCARSGAGKDGRAAGWGIVNVAKARGFSFLGGAAHGHLTPHGTGCVAAGRLDGLVAQLHDVEAQLGAAQAQAGLLEQKLQQLHPATWKTFYGAAADKVSSLRGTLGTAGAVERAFDRYELFLSDPKDQTTESADSLLDLIYPLVAEYERLEDELLPPGATSISLYEGAWRQIRAGGDYYVTQSQIDDFKVLRDYWLSLGTELATLVAEYEHARAGMSPAQHDAWGHGKTTGAGPAPPSEVASDIHDLVASAATYPQVTDLPGYAPGRPLTAQPNLPMYDPNLAYRQWNGAGFAPQPGMLWQGRCGAAGSWLPVARDQLDVLTSERPAGTPLSDWLRASSPWFASILGPNGTCPSPAPDDLAASLVVRPPTRTERFVPWLADPETGGLVMDFPGR
jgi:hypothetical protein